jgi:hypothetical protein
MTEHNTITYWEDLTDQAQIYMYWEYCASLPETDQITFQEFDEMMTGLEI